MRHLTGLAIVLLGLGAGSALALFENYETLLRSAKVTLTEAVETAIAAVPGKAVEAELESEDGQTVFEVKIIDQEGVTREVYVHAETGEVIKVGED